MRKYISYLSVFLAILFVCTGMVAPRTGEAATVKKTSAKKTIAYDLYNPNRKYKDEKIEIDDTASRCNTPAMKIVHGKNLAKALEDGKLYGFTFESVSGTTLLSPGEQAFKTYLDGLDIAWGAMEEPYCGFGAFGTQAANKSYNKSVTRLRARFLEAIKKTKTVALNATK